MRWFFYITIKKMLKYLKLITYLALVSKAANVEDKSVKSDLKT